MIDLVLTRRTTDRVPPRAFFVRIAAAADSAFRIPKGCRAELGITLIGSRAMRSLNRKRRGVDKSTDVLSFPLHMKPGTGYTAVLLGDLFICPGAVRRHARESGATVESQWSWTVIHGMLHLAGYDHEKSTAAARRMAAAERRIQTRLKR